MTELERQLHQVNESLTEARTDRVEAIILLQHIVADPKVKDEGKRTELVKSIDDSESNIRSAEGVIRSLNATILQSRNTGKIKVLHP